MALIIGTIAIINAVGLVMIVWAFRTSLRVVGEATWWFVVGFALLSFILILRGLYWDVALPLARAYAPGAAAAWSELVSGRMFNVVFSGLMMLSIYCALKCRQALIPAHERADWPWWKAWMHPTKIRFW
ncbi:hypothetical protein SAMN04489859_10203 [Paracoccus alcaliphilus]|uniref:Uncharacterized protein n=1 Tax=Paracoccus alcaliphilus TaxID=34002 RepID=A0A1H8K2B9_9RHOB|nr:hypothetical protein [Paracoccus alcaliphilus]WCR17497.1 hypothetical protein JHW40_14335 [Paracoccus alcaliphilus]SEN86955.1 hypothetical protein SAMN04489859_10203 [Paracoccus alcaliphilus]